MNIHIGPMRSKLVFLGALAGALGSFCAPARAETLPLIPGAYVSTSDLQCRSAPFADVVNYDGKGLGDPHSSHCVSTTLDKRGRRYRVSTVCRAEGDGTLLDKPERSVQVIVVNTRKTMSIITDGHPADYRLCPGYGRAQ